MKTLILIPAYNEELNLEKVVNGIKSSCPGFDYVIINDGSTDGTEALCKRNGFNFVTLATNLGFSGAVQTGYKFAVVHGYDVVAQIDGDGQHPVESIPDMVRLVAGGQCDYVLGSRFVSRKKPASMRMLGSRLIAGLIRIRTGKTVADPTSGMRVVRAEIAKKMAASLNFIAEPDTLTRVLLNGYKVREVQVQMRDREFGVSHFGNPFNSMKYMLRMAISILFYQGRTW